MNVIIVVFCVNIVVVNALKDLDIGYISRLLKILKGRRTLDTDTEETNEPVEASLMIPGFYMEKPKGMSMSSFKHPNAKYSAVYDRLDDLNTRYAKTKASDSNTGSTSSNLMAKILKGISNFQSYRAREKFDSSEESSFDTGIGTGKNKKRLANILKAVKNIKQNQGSKKRQLIILANTKASQPLKSSITKNIEDVLNGKLSSDYFSSLQPSDEIENNANEIMDADEALPDSASKVYFPQTLGLRRTSTNPETEKCKDDSETMSSSEQEKNPGNPFTIHKNKYKQNWLWNHYMDGDHMNINPFGPQFASQGPSGPDLFFGRKWWYFNQDDYKPMG